MGVFGRKPCEACGNVDYDEYWGPNCKATHLCHTEVEKIERERDELRAHLKYVCMVAERLGPKASEVHREEAVHMLDGTVKSAREILSKYEKQKCGEISPYQQRECIKEKGHDGHHEHPGGCWDGSEKQKSSSTCKCERCGEPIFTASDGTDSCIKCGTLR